MLMAVPALMVSACLFIKANVLRWINIIVGALYTVVGIGNLIGETWAYYLIYGVVEIFLAILIMVVAFKWPKNIS